MNRRSSAGLKARLLRKEQVAIGRGDQIERRFAKCAAQQQILGTVAGHDQIGSPFGGIRKQSMLWRAGDIRFFWLESVLSQLVGGIAD
jgi:hypothetical protein